jgi:DNA-binding response OmpR family regulator
MKQILIVDHESQLAEVLARVAPPDIFGLSLAATEAKALAIAARSRTHLVFVRTHPQRRVVAPLIARLRALQPSVPIVVVAAPGSSEDERALRREGILCYLEEPLCDEVVRQVVAAVSPCCGVS